MNETNASDILVLIPKILIIIFDFNQKHVIYKKQEYVRKITCLYIKPQKCNILYIKR